jgi:cephalosporin-C deacetylase-like acetyl esterase
LFEVQLEKNIPVILSLFEPVMPEGTVWAEFEYLFVNRNYSSYHSTEHKRREKQASRELAVILTRNKVSASPI